MLPNAGVASCGWHALGDGAGREQVGGGGEEEALAGQGRAEGEG